MNQRLLGFCCSAALIVGAFGYATQAHARSGERIWVAPDFFVESAPGEYAAPLRAQNMDCRAQITKALCVMDTPFEPTVPTESTEPRKCGDNPEKYIRFFEAVYDRFPPLLQQIFCSVGVLAVESQLESIAYAGMRGDYAVVGFRKSVIDEELDVSTLLSWKEQLPFGGERESYTPSPNLPLVIEKSPHPAAQDLGFYVLAHEFGHLLDFANGVNSCEGPQCVPTPGSWTALSWGKKGQPKASFDFPYRKDVCFYGCTQPPLPERSIAPLYAGLAGTGFLTLYAATNIYDDFAESLAFYFLVKEGDSSYALDTRHGFTLDLLKKVHKPAFAEKYDYIEKFVTGAIAYP